MKIEYVFVVTCVTCWTLIILCLALSLVWYVVFFLNFSEFLCSRWLNQRGCLKKWLVYWSIWIKTWFKTPTMRFKFPPIDLKNPVAHTMCHCYTLRVTQLIWNEKTKFSSPVTLNQSRIERENLGDAQSSSLHIAYLNNKR